MHGCILEVPITNVSVQNVRIVRKMSLENVEIAVEVEIADRHSHAGLFHPVLVQRHTTHEPLLSKCAVVLVHEQQARRGIAGNIDIGPPIIIEVGGRYVHAVSGRGFPDSRRLAGISESSLAVVSKQPAMSRRQTSWAAIHGKAFPGTVRTLARLRHS